MNKLKLKYIKSSILGHEYTLTMPVPKTRWLAQLCSQLNKDENGNVIVNMRYGKEGWRKCVWHVGGLLKAGFPITTEEVERIGMATLSLFDDMQILADHMDPEEDTQPADIKFAGETYRELTETFMDLLVGLEFYDRHPEEKPIPGWGQKHKWERGYNAPETNMVPETQRTPTDQELHDRASHVTRFMWELKLKKPVEEFNSDEHSGYLREVEEQQQYLREHPDLYQLYLDLDAADQTVLGSYFFKDDPRMHQLYLQREYEDHNQEIEEEVK